ncbi:MAG: choice-of-anchor B family protein [Anaerolineales bacterium]|nr:choice-of-anchor B family protein [Anaerolineales bacterium]
MVVLNVAHHPVFAQTPDPADPPRMDETAAVRMALMARMEREFQPDPLLDAPQTATPCVGGMAGIYPCLNVDLLAYMPLASIGGGSGANDIWGWTDPLDGKEYALVGLTNGTSFVEVTNPETPLYLGRLPTHTSNSTWRDIKVYNNYAFVVSEASGHGMQVFDLTRLRTVPNPPVNFTEDAFYGAFGNAHNLAINEETGFAYAIGSNTCSGGLHMINIQTPLSPSNAGCYSADGYTHDTQCVLFHGPDANYQGHEICFSANEDTLTVTDVSNKANPVLVARMPYAGSAYTHQGWLTEDHAFFLLDDELDEQNFGHNTRTRIWTLTDLTNPTIIGVEDGPNPSIDHNVYTHEGNAYMSNYTSGLQIFDLSDVANGQLVLAGFFDSYPSNNNANFNGSWSNYPYFTSGTVIHTGIGEGLFITRPSLAPSFSLSAADETMTVCTPGDASTLFTLTEQHGYTNTVTLNANNLPVGSIPTFDPQMVAVPGSSTLTVTVSTTPAGVYPFTVAAADGVLTETVDLSLVVYDALPASATLTTPVDGAFDLPVPITFSWEAGIQGVSYILEIASDAAFADIVYTANVSETSHIAKYGFDELTTYYWRIRTLNPCGEGAVSAISSFTTQAIPPILLVDDDDNNPNVRNYYTQALDALGKDYYIWDTANSDNEPTLADLAPYEIVIWFTGHEFGGAAGPGPGGELALSSWLDNNGGCLFLSSQDYYYDRGLTSFMQTYLGVDSITNDNGNYGYANGQGLFASFGSRVLYYPFSDQADTVVPDSTANLGMVGNNGNGAGLVKETETYKTTFWAFPWEAIYSATYRRVAMDLFLTWCTYIEPTPTPPPSEMFPVYLPVLER